MRGFDMTNPVCSKTGRALAAFALGLFLPSFLGAQQTFQFWTVDANNGPGTDFTTISAAVAAAAPRDRILVREGLYVENVVVDKGVTIVGWNATTYPMTLPVDPFGSAIQGTLGVINIPNNETVVISGLSVAPSAGGLC